MTIVEKPKMWAAMGDLTNDPVHYEKAIELSKGRFSHAYTSLGRYYFDKGDLVKAALIHPPFSSITIVLEIRQQQ
jgi:hypothetical protein